MLSFGFWVKIGGMEKFKFLPTSKMSQLPESSGVYAFKKGRELIYIGKAINIKERVKNHSLDQVDRIGYIKTGSEIEALVLEASLIKKYQPKNNVAWRDDKNYFYIGITKEDFPQLFITHQPQKDIQYVGPFVDGTSLKEALKFLRKAFPYRTCQNLPKHPCLWYQLNRCPAPCLFQTNLGRQIDRGLASIKKECRGNIKNLLQILRGKKVQVLKNLKREMALAAASREYERAAKIRNQIQALEKILSHARVLNLFEARPQWAYRRVEAYDVSNIQGKEATGSMVTFIDGRPTKNFYRRFKIKAPAKPNDVAMIKEVLQRRLKHREWGWPDLILIDGGKAQFNAAASVTRIKVMALAKKKNELYAEGQKKPVLLKNLPRETANLILQLRDEAHRFAKAYHHKLRKKALLG